MPCGLSIISFILFVKEPKRAPVEALSVALNLPNIALNMNSFCITRMAPADTTTRSIIVARRCFFFESKTYVNIIRNVIIYPAVEREKPTARTRINTRKIFFLSRTNNSNSSARLMKIIATPGSRNIPYIRNKTPVVSIGITQKPRNAYLKPLVFVMLGKADTYPGSTI